MSAYERCPPTGAVCWFDCSTGFDLEEETIDKTFFLTGFQISQALFLVALSSLGCTHKKKMLLH